MAKKRPTREKSWREKVSKYFSVPMNIQTCESVKAEFKRVVSDFNAGTSLTFLDQRNMSMQTLTSLAFLWMRHTLDTKGVRGLDRELEPVLKTLERMVVEDMKARGRELDPEYLPEGPSFPEPTEAKPKRGKDKGHTTPE